MIHKIRKNVHCNIFRTFCNEKIHPVVITTIRVVNESESGNKMSLRLTFGRFYGKHFLCMQEMFMLLNTYKYRVFTQINFLG
jgi:hypothetical protein